MLERAKHGTESTMSSTCRYKSLKRSFWGIPSWMHSSLWLQNLRSPLSLQERTLLKLTIRLRSDVWSGKTSSQNLIRHRHLKKPQIRLDNSMEAQIILSKVSQITAKSFQVEVFWRNQDLLLLYRIQNQLSKASKNRGQKWRKKVKKNLWRIHNKRLPKKYLWDKTWHIRKPPKIPQKLVKKQVLKTKNLKILTPNKQLLTYLTKQAVLKIRKK